ncbi:hypothetical protein SS50377_28288 [Spironucleus salmonicida]|uniref:Uncharacterized protein n=1 Tax=Spironucleus salmonicida TaxID=348837 RepID=V6LW41_9EUKA|nr:hypothetical protein SS50377_28288 [Spironucleus salmonicida]|eukprot:EST48468.1 Hypothetical protein SS50377_11417 [Spironucleus salmonicida]
MSKQNMQKLATLEKVKLQASEMQKQIYQITNEIQHKRSENEELPVKLERVNALHAELQTQVEQLQQKQQAELPDDIRIKLENEENELEKPREILQKMKLQRKQFQTHLADYSKANITAKCENDALKKELKTSEKSASETLKKYQILMQNTKDIQRYQSDLDNYRETIELYRSMGEKMTLDIIKDRMENATQLLEKVSGCHDILLVDVKDRLKCSKFGQYPHRKINYLEQFLAKQEQVLAEVNVDLDGKDSECAVCQPVLGSVETVDCACG